MFIEVAGIPSYVVYGEVFIGLVGAPRRAVALYSTEHGKTDYSRELFTAIQAYSWL